MIKELWILVKMLFASNPKEIGEAEVMDMQHFPFKGYKAMSWCGVIIHRVGTSDVDAKTINHETIHLMQAKLCGSWVKYYLKYLWEWLRRGFLSPMTANYYVSKYECEAYANEDDFDYCNGYDGENLGKYTIKNAKKLYKQLGCTSAAWKNYIKSL